MENINDILSKAQVETHKSPERGKARNKNAGHGFERWCVKWWVKLGFPHVQTSRQESRSRDNDQIDLMNKDEHINGRFEYNVQDKCYSSTPDYTTIFHGGYKWKKIKRGQNKGERVKVLIKPMPTVKGIINVVFHKLVIKDDITGKFNPANIDTEASIYVTMKLSDFEIIVKERLELQELRKLK